ncbi:MAG: asparagine synthase (glutamine-hydrolyzing), partial [Burkholderiales bacterium]
SRVALGHNRLSIIDLSPLGRQPMGNEQTHVIYNGEIYNFAKLREELIAAGCRFTSRTDTEVLVWGYEQWGLSGLLERLDGMFAFALFDARAHKLHLVRDHLGIKPLYYANRDGVLVFASEPKALIGYDETAPTLDRAGLLLSAQHIGIPAPSTIYQGYRQLEPGSYLSFDLATGEIATARYWQWKIEPEIRDSESAANMLWQTLCESVESQLVADVPVGVFLSGGLDSSLIAAACAECGHKPVCVTIALPERHDESPDAAALCRHYGLPHWVEVMRVDEAAPYDRTLAQIYDEPFGSSAALSALYISKLAAGRFKVMLSGDGGDELFGGYHWYRRWVNWYGANGNRVPLWTRPRNALRAALGRSHFAADPLQGYAQLMGAYDPEELAGLFDSGLLSAHGNAGDASAAYRRIDDPRLWGYDRLQSLDMQLFLPTVCLTKMDRASMTHSLEVRVPMLGKFLVRLAARIDVNVRNPDAELKGLLKQVARKKLPQRLLSKHKRGFSTPTRRWFPRSMIVEEIARDLANQNWWHGIFAPTAAREAKRLRGGRLWRFWQTWKWVKRVCAANLSA